MLLDRFNRKIDYLRISVTDRCNQRCIYCMPETNFVAKSHDEILSYEQIARISKEAAELGITKIRLTGGEPLVRRYIERLIEEISAIDGIEEVCMTTNGTRLVEYAGLLKQSGLTRVNISIDTLDAEKYKQITRGGILEHALEGVDAAVEAGLTPIKINMVIFDDTKEEEIETMRGFCAEKKLRLQKIMRFQLYDRADLDKRFHTERPPKCVNCNRIRLTSDGFLKPCLFSNDEIKINFNDISGSILDAVGRKMENGSSCKNRFMNQIGG